MALDLLRLHDVIESKGFEAEFSEGCLDWPLADGLVPRFVNSDDGDEAVGFVGTSWYFHPPLIVEVGDHDLREMDLEAFTDAMQTGRIPASELDA